MFFKNIKRFFLKITRFFKKVVMPYLKPNFFAISLGKASL